MKKHSTKERLQEYFDAFSECAEKKEMCGISAMFSDSGLFPDALQNEINNLVQTELHMIEKILIIGIENGELKATHITSKELAIIVNSTVKGALMLNRTEIIDSYSKIVSSLIIMLNL